MHHFCANITFELLLNFDIRGSPTADFDSLFLDHTERTKSCHRAQFFQTVMLKGLKKVCSPYF